eukprot:scaffold45595_cov17-Tisochrysis_lutea.AAC.1
MLAECLAFAVGIMDVAAYMLNCLGFPIVGSALSISPSEGVIASMNSFSNNFMQGCVCCSWPDVHSCSKDLTAQKRNEQAAMCGGEQSMRVAIVVVGVMIRAGPFKTQGHAEPLPSNDNVRLGVAYTTCSAALYSLLGVVYE